MCGGITLGAGDHRNALECCGWTRICAIEVDVVADEKIEIAVEVEVGERGAGSPTVIVNARSRGDVLEGSVALVAQQDIGAEARDKDVVETVGVDIADSNAEAPTVVLDRA